MAGFRGRFGAKQCIPNKPTKFGVKAFTLADSKNGYILEILLYKGGDILDNSDSQQCHLPQPARIGVYYTSIPLALSFLHWNFCEQTETNSSQFSAKELSFCVISLMPDIRRNGWMGVASLIIKCTPAPLLWCNRQHTAVTHTWKEVRFAIE